jgi:UDP-glucose 4-epimerase
MTEIKRVLVTGGCGFVGANLVRLLRLNTGWSIRVVDNLQAGRKSYLNSDTAEVLVGDIAQDDVLQVALEGVDAVVHLASRTGVVPSVENPIQDFFGNPVPTIRVLEACRTRGVDRMVFASSGAALGGATPPLHEEIVPRPLSPYGAGKLTGEAYCSAYARSFDMNAVSLRFSNVYGPYSQHKGLNAVPTFIKRSLRNQVIEIFGDGSQTRDFIYVDDVCAVIQQCLTTDGLAGEIFQLGTGVETSIRDLARIVQETTGVSTNIQFRDRRPGEIYKSHVDISKAREVLGFKPRLDIRHGVAKTTDWYRENWLPATDSTG